MSSPRRWCLVLTSLLLDIPLLGSALALSNPTRRFFEYQHLEINGQLWRFCSHEDDGNLDAARVDMRFTSILVDPLVDTLDFGLPRSVYFMKPATLINSQSTIETMVDSKPSVILLTQVLDDHTHLPTLRRLANYLSRESFVVIAPPSAREKLKDVFPASHLRVLHPGQAISIRDDDRLLYVQATAGSRVGPPWQAPENGYVVKFEDNPSSALCTTDGSTRSPSVAVVQASPAITSGGDVYYAPHNDILPSKSLKGITASVCISPVIETRLPAFTLVHGQEKALALALHLQASTVIPLRNGEIKAEGVLAGLVSSRGEPLAAQRAFQERGIDFRWAEPAEVVRVELRGK